MEYISLKNARARLNISKSTLYSDVLALKLQKHTFQLDREFYLSIEDFEKLKKLREEKAQRRAVV